MDTVHGTPKQAAEPVAPWQVVPPKPLKLAAAKPAMNRHERVIFTAYLSMIVMIAAFLAVTGLVAWLGA
jgi:hypothetical protein